MTDRRGRRLADSTDLGDDAITGVAGVVEEGSATCA
jgi:hypothetical protein